MATFYITTAIDYINGLPHIGTAYEKITADCIARAKRLLGYDVRFCMGTDEHSINVKKKALEEGIPPQTYCDNMVPKFEEIWRKLNISYDDFIRTTDQRHKIGVTELFRRIKEAGDIYTADYKGWYCEGCEAFIQDKDLVDGTCPHHRTKPSWIEETNYFFRLSKFGDRLLEHITAHPGFIRPESRRNEIVRLIESGLEDISVSRSGFDWGIPLPDDPDHVVYVWFDALINYISALGFGSDDGAYGKYWPANAHIIGKDITRFHCVIWPAMLMSAGIELPKTVFGHGFIYHSGERMSKSLGNVVSPLDIVDRFGADPLRYYLLREVTYGLDGDFTFDRFIERYNSDLANDLGNLVSRTTTMIQRYLGGSFPKTVELPPDGVSAMFPEVLGDWTGNIEDFNLNGAIDRAWDLVRAANRRIEDTAPWNLAKDESKRDDLTAVLYDLLAAIGGISMLLKPYMPQSAEAIWNDIGFTGDFASLNLSTLSSVPLPPVGTQIRKHDALFPRIESTAQTEQKAAKMNNTAHETDTPDSEYLEFPDFAKVDLRVGTVTSAEKVQKSDKLIRLKIDDGAGGRQVLAGIAGHMDPDRLVGMQVVFVANLKPRNMMGEQSQGMVLAAVDGAKLTLLRPSEDVSPGTKVS